MLSNQRTGGCTPQKANIRDREVDNGAIKLWHHEFAVYSTLRVGKKCRLVHQTISGPGPWWHPLDGQAHKNICGTHFQYYRIAHSQCTTRRVLGKQGTRKGIPRAGQGIVQYEAGQ
jgi:hypothetical protein